MRDRGDRYGPMELKLFLDAQQGVAVSLCFKAKPPTLLIWNNLYRYTRHLPELNVV